MSLSCDIYRWHFHKKAITKFCYKDNFLCLSVFSNCAYFIAGCMRSLAFFSLPYFPSSKTAFLIPLFQEIGKLCQLPIGSDLFENIQFDLWFSDYLKKIKSNILCSSFIPYLCFRPKRALKEVARLWIFVRFFIQNPWVNFFAKDPKKAYLIIWFSNWEQQLAF